jgi:two-component system, OmpR family, KDP operon response regulator KdpE
MIGKAAPVKVLVVDGEAAVRRFLRTSLATQGYEVMEADNGSGALDMLRRNRVDILVLELGLPDINGLEVIDRVRGQGWSVPIVVLSSRTDETGKVDALDRGADDYVTKPFGIYELLARLRAALRHRLQQEGESPAFRCGDLAVDLVRRNVTLAGHEVKLTPREYDLLHLLVSQAGKVLTHRFILRELWGGGGDVQYLRVYIGALRNKIEPNPARPCYILTEQGVGYRMRAAD